MNISDPIADMLTRIRNASRARHTEVVLPASRTKREIARIPDGERIASGFTVHASVGRDGRPRRLPEGLSTRLAGPGSAEA